MCCVQGVTWVLSRFTGEVFIPSRVNGLAFFEEVSSEQAADDDS